MNRELVAAAVIAFGVWLVAVTVCVVACGDEVVIHLDDQHYLLSSQQPIPADLSIRKVRSIGDDQAPDPPTPGDLSKKVKVLRDRVPKYPQRAEDRRVYGAVFTAIAVRQPEPSEVRAVWNVQFDAAKRHLSIDFESKWGGFRDGIAVLLQSADLRTKQDVTEWYGTVGEVLLQGDAQLANAGFDFRTLVQIIMVIVDGVNNQKPFFDILLEILRVLGL